MPQGQRPADRRQDDHGQHQQTEAENADDDRPGEAQPEPVCRHAAEPGEDQHPAQHKGEGRCDVVEVEARLADQRDLDEEIAEAERREIDDGASDRCALRADPPGCDQRQQHYGARDKQRLGQHG
jgi:hypothetical protein